MFSFKTNDEKYGFGDFPCMPWWLMYLKSCPPPPLSRAIYWGNYCRPQSTPRITTHTTLVFQTRPFCVRIYEKQQIHCSHLPVQLLLLFCSFREADILYASSGVNPEGVDGAARIFRGFASLYRELRLRSEDLLPLHTRGNMSSSRRYDIIRSSGSHLDWTTDQTRDKETDH
jgi:hypothetical protein